MTGSADCPRPNQVTVTSAVPASTGEHPTPSRQSGTVAPTTAVDAYLAAISAADRAAAVEVVRRCQADGATAVEVMARVIAPAQARVGELWATDAWSVAQEHAATAVSEAVVAVLAAQIPSPRSSTAPVVVSCVEQEWHALPALLVAEHLRAADVPVSYLGANASAEDLVRHVAAVSPRAVALSCSLASSLPRVRLQVEAVRATGTPVVVGGSAFDADGRRADAVGADAFAASGVGAVEALRGLGPDTTPLPAADRADATAGFAVHAAREMLSAQLRMHTALTGLLPAVTVDAAGWQRAMADHLPHLVGAVAGALVVHDPQVLTESLRWLEDVLAHRGAPPSALTSLNRELHALMAEHPEARRLLERVA